MISGEPNSLPLSFQVLGFILSVLLAGFKVFDFLRKPTLHVEITRDVFFRLIDEGEALFCGPVLLANNGPVLVRKIRPTLRKISGTEELRGGGKTFPLMVAHVGEKVHGDKLLAEHKFYGSTVLQYLASAQPYRAVYVCFEAEYQEKQRRAVADYENALINFKAEKQSSTEEQKQEILVAFERLIDTHYHSMAGMIQVEAGSYELEVEFDYECIGWRFWGSKKQASAKLSFKLADADISRWKAALRDLLLVKGRQILTDSQVDVTYPQLTPYDIQER